MNWLKNVIRPRLRQLVGVEKKDVPENLWHQCPACNQMIFHRELDNHQLFFAMGEAIAHINFLWHASKIQREIIF